MLALYQSLLYLYPPAYRREFDQEMLDVLAKVQAETRKRTVLARAVSAAHEAGGLLCGALREHLWIITGSQGKRRLSPMFSPTFLAGRFAMRSEFRFPKATVALMTVILAAVMFTIEKAEAISASIPHANPPVGPIHSTQFAIVPPLLMAMISAFVVGVIGWGVLFALHRSGVQQLSGMNPSAGQR